MKQAPSGHIIQSNLTKNYSYDLEYFYLGRRFIYRCSIKRGPPNVVCILNDAGDDITDKVAPYLGPNEDFHANPYTITPSDFNEDVFDIVTYTDKRFTKLKNN